MNINFTNNKQNFFRTGGIGILVLFFLLVSGLVSAQTAIENSFTVKYEFGTGTSPRYVALGDLDGDGFEDIVVANNSDNTISVFRNISSPSGKINYAAQQTFATGLNPTNVEIGDLDGDGKQDLVVTNSGGNSISVLRNTSAGTGAISFAAKVDFAPQTSPNHVAIGDLDGDGKMDLAVTNSGSQTISIFRNTGSAGVISFAAQVAFATGVNTLPLDLAMADMDGDSKLEVIVINFVGGTASILRNVSTGSGDINFAAKVDIGVGGNPRGLVIFDMDDDGKKDLATIDGLDKTLNIRKNTSSGIGTISLGPTIQYSIGGSPFGIAKGDLNGDGKEDIAVANELVASVFLNLSTSAEIAFNSKLEFDAATTPTYVAIGHADDDLKSDLFLSSPDNNLISILRNSDSPLAFYPFNGDANDVSGNGNNGVVNAGVTFTSDRHGNAGASASFDGTTNAFIDLGATSIDFTSGLTFSVWSKSSATNAWERYVDMGETGGLNNVFFGRSFMLSTLVYQVFNGTEQVVNFEVADAIVENQWQQYVVTHDVDQSIKIYVDGVLIGTGTGPLPVTATRTESYLGKSLFNGDGFLQGELDEVRIYNKAITEAEVSALYQSSNSGLVAHYPFNGDSNDLSGNGLDGIINGASPATDRFGMPNGAYYFDGSSSIEVVNAAAFDFDDFTYSVWVSPDLISTGFATVVSTSNDQAWLGQNNGFWEPYGVCPASNQPAVTLGWHHLVWVKSGTNATVYLDNVPVVTSTSCGIGFMEVAGIMIGNNALGESFRGSIDDLKIYNRALSASEISNLFSESAFVTTWEVTNPDLTITISTEVGLTYDFDIDWGDGTVLTNLTGDVSHTYASAGIKTISINGVFPHFKSYSKDKIRSVEQWGNIVWSSMNFTFGDVASGLAINATDAPDLSQVTDMSLMFKNLNFTGDNLKNWDVSNVQNMWSMFFSANFNEDLSSWNVANVTNMSSMFIYTGDSYFGDISNWNVSSCIDMNGMFQNNVDFNTDISGWNVSNVTNMASMFGGASLFNADISGWNVSNISEMGQMFQEAESFNQPIGNWNVSKVVNMPYLFLGALSFNQNLSGWDISQVGNFDGIFNGTNMSLGNYDNTLDGWATLDAGETQIPTNVIFGAYGVPYCSSNGGRNTLINDYGWEITGDVFSCPNVVAEYSFDGDATDLSGNGYNGIINGASSAVDRFANNDAAYSFNGVDQDITISDVEVIFSEITVSVWLNFGTGQGDGAHTLIDLSGLAGIALEDNEILGVLNIQNDYSITNKLPLNPNEWHHVTMTYDQSDLVLFVDGEIASVRNLPGLITQEATLYDMTIGRIGLDLNRYYGGILDDIRIFNRALSSSEVAGLYTEKGYVSQRDILMTFYNSTDGANWFNNTGWGTAADLSTWHGLTLENGNVASLDLRSNNLNGTVPASIAELQSLNELFFFNNLNLGGAIPAELGNLTNLTRLSFQACSMTGDIPAELGNLTSLTFLVLGPNQLTGSVPDSFANFANITIFAIHQNQLTSLPDLSGMPATIFWVQENKFTFDELLVNLPQANTANANFGPQTADDSYEYIAVNGETIELSTNETALGTTYQWYFNDAIIEGADLVNHIFDFTNADEGTYYCVMANDNVPGVTITRANIILDNGINTIPTGIELSNNILNDGELAGFYVGSFTTIDEDPADMHTYSLVAGIGDTFNGEFIIEEDQLIISTDVDYVVNPVYQIRVATTDSSGEIFEQTFEVLVKPFMVCNNNYFTDASGTFSDGSGVFNYDDNFSCSWQIEVPEGYVRLDFSAFDTELDYDFVRIYDGYDASAPLLAEFSGTTIPATFVSPSNALYITFITDQLVNSAGWTASYSAVTPVAFYPFNGNAFDESGNGNDGTVNEAVLVADRFGNADEAYNFDGANDAISGDASSFPSGAAPRTISGWINVLEQTGYLMTYGSTAVEGGMFGLGIQGGLPIFWGHFADVYGSQVINYNEWVFLAFTYDGANLSIYVNGELDTTAPLILDTQPASYFDIASNWSGSMDDITIYDVALSPKAIEQLYSENGWPNVPANLIPNLSSAGGKHWKLAPRDHAFYVGPSIGSSEWYANTQVDVTERDCLFDDQFIFYDDGTFLIDLNGLIWAEDYLANFGCVTIDQLPLAFQVMGQGAYTYSTAASSANSAITVNGAGAFLGFSKGYNGGEYPTDGTGNPVSSITYTILNYEVIENKEYMTITIDISPDLDGTSWWTYELVHDPLVASYAFNGNANDQTSNNLDGTVNGAVSANDRTGSANAAYSFDGVSSFIQTPATLEDFAPFSISTWVKWDGNNSDFTEIVSWWNNSAISKTYLGTSPTTNEIRFGDSWPNTGAFLPTNQWVNLVATFDGAVARIYTDGNLAATSTAGLTYGFDGDLYIGTQGTQGGEFFGGLIDDIEIYTRQLSDEEILSSYEANKTDLLAYYPFRGDLIDAIGNGFDGLELTSGNSFVPDRIGTNGSGSADAYNIDYFSGGAFEISNSANYDFGDEITVMTWVRPDLYETNDIQIIDNVLDGFGFHLYLIVGDVPVEEQSFKRKLYAAIPGVSWGEAGEVLTDRWTHIAFKYTRGCCIRLYINGQEVAAYGLAAGGEDAPIAISSSALLVGTGHHGFLDELKIFKTALTNEEIYAEYANNLWPFANTTILGPDGAVDYPMDIVTSDAFGNETNVHAKVIDIPLGNYQIHGDGNGLNTYFGDNELDGFVEPFGTQVALNAGIHAFRFDHSNLSYYMEPITSIGLIGSARTGDDTGGTAEDELVDLGNGIYQIKNIKLYDGEWKLRMNNQWNILDWGWHGTEGQLAYIGQNIPISAGTYTISVDLINNRYSVIETTPGLWETVAELEFNGDLLDTSGFDNHGTSASTTHTTDRFGVANGAISLGAFDFVSIGTDPEIQLNNGFTMNMWINPADNNNAGGLFTSTASFHQHLYSTGIDWRYFQNGQEIPINGIPVTAPNSTWTMFTWVYDGGEMRFYDDGVLVHSELVFGNLDLPGNSYDIGNGYAGAVDQFIWVDGVLNDYEILSLYNDGLVASYALDGNTVDAINGYDGVANGGLIYGLNRFGDNPAAGVFDGIDDYIDLGTAPAQHINQEITLAAWIKGGNQVDGGILGWWLGFRLEVRSDQQTVNFGTYGLSNDIMTSNTLILDNEWHLIVGTYDGFTKTLYVDGKAEVQLDNVGLQGNPYQYGDPIRIGVDVDNNFFEGEIDDVGIYDRALNADEVLELYATNGWLAQQGGIIVHYDFDGNVSDQSGNGNDGIVNGATLANDRYLNTNAAYYFDGNNQNVETGVDPSLQVSNQLTISTWVYVDEDTGVDVHNIAAQGALETNDAWEFSLSSINEISLSKNNLIEGEAASSGFFDSYKWAHIAVTFNAGITRFYINGTFDSEVDKSSVFTDFLSTDDLIRIGERSDISATDDFKGSMDDLRIYNIALSDQEITDIYNQDGGAIQNVLFTTINENFETQCLPEFWREYHTGVDLINCATSSVDGDNFVALNGFGVGSGQSWLITYLMDFDPNLDYNMSFEYINRFVGPEPEVLYSTDYNGSPDPTGFAWNHLTDVETAILNKTEAGVVPNTGDILLPNISGVAAIAFRYTSNGPSANESVSFSVDNLSVNPIIPSLNPTALDLSSTSIDENLNAGTEVGVFTTTDQDSNVFTYSLVSGTGDADNASFTISGDQLLNTEMFDFETKSSYSILVRTDDGEGGMLDQQFTIAINDVFEPTPGDPYLVDWASDDPIYKSRVINGTMYAESKYTISAESRDYLSIVTFSEYAEIETRTEPFPIVSGGANLRAFDMDTDGNIYGLYIYDGSVDINGIKTSQGANDLLLVKYDPDGQIISAVPMGGTGDELGYVLEVLNSGEILIGFSVDQSLTYQGVNINTSGVAYIHMKLTTNFAFVSFGSNTNWTLELLETADGKIFASGGGNVSVRELNLTDYSVIRTLLMPNGVNLGGWVSYDLDTQGNVVVQGQEVTNAAPDIFIGKQNLTSGDWLWHQVKGGVAGEGENQAAAVDAAGDVFLGSTFYGNFDWQSGETLTSFGDRDILLAKLDGNTGELLYLDQMGSTGSDSFSGVEAIGSEFYVYGYFNGDGGVIGSKTYATNSHFFVNLSQFGPTTLPEPNALSAYGQKNANANPGFSSINNFDDQVTDDMTVEVMIRMDAADAYSTLLQYPGFSLVYFSGGGAPGDNTIISYFGDGVNTNYNQVAESEFGGFAVGEWHHFAFRYKAPYMSLYVDGIPLSKIIAPQWTKPATAGLLEVHPNGFAASVDELRIWNYARSLEEIQSNMTKELSLPQTGLTGYWSFDELTELSSVQFSTPDLSGNGNDLQFGIDANIKLDLNAPIITSVTNLQSDAFTINWNAIDFATGYSVQLATDEGFSNIIVDQQEVGTSFSFGALTEGSTYYARVKAVAGQNESAFSGTEMVSTPLAQNQAPVITANQVFNIDENKTEGTIVGTVDASDPDGNAITFSILSGNINNAFIINELTGEISVADRLQLDFETQAKFELTIQVSDNFLTAQAVLTIDINDVDETVNQAPQILDQTLSDLLENSPNGTVVGQVVAVDPNGDGLSYVITFGNSGDAFAISTSGEITVANQNSVDYESSLLTDHQFVLTVQVTDDSSLGALSTSATITIKLIDVNENSTPTAISFANSVNTIPENEAPGATKLTLQTTDADPGDTHTYSIISDPTSSFKIDETDGTKLVSTKVFNYETLVPSHSLSIIIQTEDNNGATFQQNLTVNIGDVDDPTLITEISAPTSYTLGGVGISVTVKIADEDGLSATTILYRKLAASNYTEESLTDLGDNYSFTIDNGSFDNLGVEFYFFAQDRFGSVNSASTVIYSEVATDAIDISSNVSPGMLEANYRILAFPFQTTKVSDVFSELGTIDKTKWRLLRWKNNTSSYEDLTTSSTLSAGEGYWFLSSETVSVKTGGKSVTLVDGVYKINLGAEWNLIGNPFQGSLNWAKVLEHNITNNVIQDGNVATTLDGWSGSWNDKTSLSSFEGAFINVTTAVTGFEIPASAVTGAGRESESIRKPQEVNIDNEEWDFRMYFKTPSYSYNAGGIGMKPNAEDEADYFDKQQLPNFSIYLDMMFEEGVIRSTKKTDDFKTWNFTVPNSLPEKYIDMTWDIPVSFGKTIIFVDAASHQIYDLSKTRNIQLANNPSAKHQLYYGDKAEIFANLNLPFDALFNIYPNPVRDVLNLEIYSKENKTTTIEFISIEGKSVYSELLDLQQGVSAKQIDLLGKSIPNGVYLISIDAKITTKFIKQ